MIPQVAMERVASEVCTRYYNLLGVCVGCDDKYDLLFTWIMDGIRELDEKYNTPEKP